MQVKIVSLDFISITILSVLMIISKKIYKNNMHKIQRKNIYISYKNRGKMASSDNFMIISLFPPSPPSPPFPPFPSDLFGVFVLQFDWLQISLQLVYGNVFPFIS